MPIDKGEHHGFHKIALYYTVCLPQELGGFFSFFLTLFVTMFGSTLIPLLFFQETPGWLKDSKYFYLFTITFLLTKIILNFAPRLLRNKVSLTMLNFGLQLSISQIILNYLLKTSTKFPNAELVICSLISYVCGSLPHKLFIRNQPEERKYDEKCLTIASILTVALYIIIRRPNLIFAPLLNLPFFPTGKRLEADSILSKICDSLRTSFKGSKKVMSMLKTMHSYNTNPTDSAVALFGRGPKHQIPLIEIQTLRLRQFIGLSVLVSSSLFFAFMSALDFAKKTRAQRARDEEMRREYEQRRNRF
ncbi:hypothetical protein BLNAU_18084 [Blattamonas nauphoetae]|uniref:Transmembrane protein n=1 Tax=Blattamonas nauphoetae TaxID=2049346 RepID=A0ABQ9X5Y3_9EUKA|nr:hypothetical protein BLNAU_18084 [Blattamonas nauphoetae]